jgi:L-ascorbate metabolism protein UlaG (beta-lactamase superfamily)
VIEPFRSDDALLAEIAAAEAAPRELHLWWLGQSGFLVQWQGRRLLLDPYLSDSLTRKYAATDKPHVRMTRRAVDPARLPAVDVVTSSHSHTDHLDRDTLLPILASSPDAALVIPEANRDFVAERLGTPPGRPLGLDDGESVAAGGFRIHAVPAAHEELERDERGRHRFLGYVVRAGPWTLYHSGDTLRYPGMEERLEPFRVDVAMLPINGRAPERRVAGNLDGPEAARLANDVGARLVIPCHYEMFEFNTASPGPFVREAERLGQPYRVLRCGERWSSSELAATAG